MSTPPQSNFNIPTPNTQTPVLGIIALVLGIISILISFIPCVGVFATILAVPAVILGIVSIVQANKTGGQKGMGIAGLCLGIVALFIALFWTILLTAFAPSMKDIYDETLYPTLNDDYYDDQADIYVTDSIVEPEYYMEEDSFQQENEARDRQ